MGDADDSDGATGIDISGEIAGATVMASLNSDYEGDKMNNIYRLLNINHSPDKYILNKSNQHVEITDEIKTQIIDANEYDIKFYDYIYNLS